MSRSALTESGKEKTQVLTKVMCLSRASPVSPSTLSGSVITTCTSSGSSPQAARQSRIPCTKIKDDQATFSDGLTTIAFPVASAAMMGEIKLSVAGGDAFSTFGRASASGILTERIVPADNGGDDAERLVHDFRDLVREKEICPAGRRA